MPRRTRLARTVQTFDFSLLIGNTVTRGASFSLPVEFWLQPDLCIMFMYANS
jgi:hypothetical protein